jgi:ParB family chromosome partitioning protein
MTVQTNTEVTTTPATETVAPAASMEWIALSKLSVAEENVRRTDRKGGIEGLAESIAAEGLLQNLTGFATEKGRYRIVAGGRRLTALRLLAKAGRWSGPVPVRVLPSGTDAQRISLTENVVRAALHPADEFEAFAALIAERHEPAEVARRFGTTVRHVEQRMKLAAVSPTLVKAYRAGDMTLDQLTAFAVVDDHTRQEQVWTTYHVRDSTGRGIRMALLSEHVPVTDKLARFVGLDAYEAAGGPVIRDLFSDEEGGTWLADPDLLRRLAAERMQAEAEAITAEAWAWVETFESLPYSGFYNHGRVYPRPLPLSDDHHAALATLTSRRNAILASLDNAPDDTLAEELATVETAISAMHEREYGFTAEDRARAGCAIGLMHDGRLKVERGLIRPEDVRRERKVQAKAEEVAARVAGTVGTVVAEATAPALSDTLVEELTTQRTAALRVEVMRRPDLALTGVVHALALPVFYTHAWRAESVMEIRATSIGLTDRLADPDACPALREINEVCEAWGHRVPGDAGDLWEWLTGQSQDVLLELLAFLAAGSVNAVKQRHEHGRPGRIEHADRMAVSVGLDMTAWWTVDAAFLTRLSKAQIAIAVVEGVSAELAAPLAKITKGEAVQRAAAALEGRGWLPKPLRMPIDAEELAAERSPVEVIGAANMMAA